MNTATTQPPSDNPQGEILIYQTEDGQTKIQVSLKDNTVWLSLDQLATLFQRDKSTISRHIKNIFDTGELESEQVVAFFATTASDGKTPIPRRRGISGNHQDRLARRGKETCEETITTFPLRAGAAKPPPAAEGRSQTMTIAALSDLHGYVPSPAAQVIVDKADVVCICGDIESRAMHTFAWINELNKPVVFTPGNHDWLLYDSAGAKTNWGFCPHVHVLIDDGCEIDGVHFWGTPWSPIFFDWAFMLPPDGLREKYAKIPEGIDVLLCHSPPRIPRSRIDTVEGRRDHCGSVELAEAVRRARPRHLLCGHIHTGDHTPVRLASTTCRNVSYLDERYAPAFLPALIEL